ncbi:DUF2231 domain-containing protein [Sporomusa sp.]|uniref:DUF2231 domain-containing protein n=1 Tax=Sporomusa sp. TaxID=2078658 RepID=UPI002C82DA58|nr:DUF2231 domain-containing protein [Sporomusa sp.]HWR08303.1 DUF2231 domain-containing protein [Sporomusa sp.]
MQNLHPALIHFPIALLLIGFLFDILSTVLKRNSLRSAGWWCLLVGGVSLAAAIGSGVYAESTAGHNDASHVIMERHKQIEYVATALFGLLLVWRSLRKTMLPQSMVQLAVYYAIGVFAIGTMAYGAHLGGRLVYEYGVGVAAVSQGESGGHEHNHGEGSDHHRSVTPEPGTSTVPKAVPASPKPARPGETHTHSDGSAHTH